MKTALWVMVVVGLACQGARGPQGERGPVGADGLVGPQGPGAGSIVWKDYRGTIGGYGDPPRHFDGLGAWWFVDPETAQVDLARHQVGIATPNGPALLFEAADCTGEPYMFASSSPAAWPSPRVPFVYRGEPTFRVRLDDAKAETRMMASTSDATGCTALLPPTVVREVLATSRTTGWAGPPQLPAIAPLHPSAP